MSWRCAVLAPNLGEVRPVILSKQVQYGELQGLLHQFSSYPIFTLSILPPHSILFLNEYATKLIRLLLEPVELPFRFGWDP